MTPRYRRMLVAWNAVAFGLGDLMAARKGLRHDVRTARDEARRGDEETPREDDRIAARGESING